MGLGPEYIFFSLANKELFSLTDFHDKPLGSEEGEYVSLTDTVGGGWGDGYVIHKNLFSFIIK